MANHIMEHPTDCVNGAETRGAAARLGNAGKFGRNWRLLLCSLIIGACVSVTAHGEPPAAPSVAPSPRPDMSPAERRARLLEQHAAKLRLELADQEYTIITSDPFVVIGNESPDVVARRLKHTINWAAQRLRREYFTKSPSAPLEIWLLNDEASYRQVCTERFDLEPTTPFGFYLSRKRALLMNISTGSGTLVHELVHPYIEVNFPKCPAWFNEGLASLYEQCQDRNGRIWGLTNWRLRRLQLQLHDDRVLTFEQLCGLRDTEFYDDTTGLHYAQARYLCHFLQEKALLTTFYREFRENVAVDPSGYETLSHLLREKIGERWEAEWRSYAASLRFDG